MLITVLSLYFGGMVFWQVTKLIATLHYRRALLASRPDLIAAIIKRDHKQVVHLLELGRDPNEMELAIAPNGISTSEPEKFRLLDAREPINREPLVRSALMVAAEVGSTEIAKSLIEAGANTNFRNALGASPLSFAVGAGQLPIVKLLISSGADPTAASGLGSTLLNDAADGGDISIIAELLSAGCDVNEQTEDGDSPLITASWSNRGSCESIRVLLTAGADPLIKNHEGLTALDIAKKCRRRDLIQIMRSWTSELNTVQSEQ